jgi:sugar phosphate isomerase/epimerase
VDEEDSMRNFDRRAFLRRLIGTGAAAAASIPLCSLIAGEAAGKKAPWAEEPKGDFAPFHIALQTYSLRKFDFEKTVETVFFDLKINFVDLWPDHFPMDLPEAEFRRHLKTMRQNMVRRIAYGVVELGKDPAKDEKVFEFAKKLNVYALTANPAPEGLEAVEKLAEKYAIAVAIHNHGPEDKRYGTPDLIEKALAGRGPRIGLCIDTGHFLLAGVNPVDVVGKFKGRIHAVHLKDVKSDGGKKKEVILGQGDLDLVGLLKALKESGFKGGLAVEYEEEPENPVASIAKGLDAVKAAVKRL